MADSTFKKIFGEPNKHLLISLLNSLQIKVKPEIPRIADDLPHTLIAPYPILKILDVAYLNPELASDDTDEKTPAFDIVVETSDGYRIGIESQHAQLAHKARVFRSTIRHSRMFNFKPVITVSFYWETLFPELKEYVNQFESKHSPRSEIASSFSSCVLVELGKFNISQPEKLKTPLDKWCFFLKFAQESRLDVWRQIPDVTRELMYAFAEAAFCNFIDNARYVQYFERKSDMKSEGRIEFAVLKTAKRIAKQLKAANCSLELIAQSTNLTEEQIKKL